MSERHDDDGSFGSDGGSGRRRNPRATSSNSFRRVPSIRRPELGQIMEEEDLQPPPVPMQQQQKHATVDGSDKREMLLKSSSSSSSMSNSARFSRPAAATTTTTTGSSRGLSLDEDNNDTASVTSRKSAWSHYSHVTGTSDWSLGVEPDTSRIGGLLRKFEVMIPTEDTVAAKRQAQNNNDDNGGGTGSGLTASDLERWSQEQLEAGAVGPFTMAKSSSSTAKAERIANEMAAAMDWWKDRGLANDNDDDDSQLVLPEPFSTLEDYDDQINGNNHTNNNDWTRQRGYQYDEEDGTPSRKLASSRFSTPTSARGSNDNNNGASSGTPRRRLGSDRLGKWEDPGQDSGAISPEKPLTSRRKPTSPFYSSTPTTPTNQQHQQQAPSPSEVQPDPVDSDKPPILDSDDNNSDDDDDDKNGAAVERELKIRQPAAAATATAAAPVGKDTPVVSDSSSDREDDEKGRDQASTAPERRDVENQELTPVVATKEETKREEDSVSSDHKSGGLVVAINDQDGQQNVEAGSLAMSPVTGRSISKDELPNTPSWRSTVATDEVSDLEKLQLELGLTLSSSQAFEDVGEHEPSELEAAVLFLREELGIETSNVQQQLQKAAPGKESSGVSPPAVEKKFDMEQELIRLRKELGIRDGRVGSHTGGRKDGGGNALMSRNHDQDANQRLRDLSPSQTQDTNPQLQDAKHTMALSAAMAFQSPDKSSSRTTSLDTPTTKADSDKMNDDEIEKYDRMLEVVASYESPNVIAIATPLPPPSKFGLLRNRRIQAMVCLACTLVIAVIAMTAVAIPRVINGSSPNQAAAPQIPSPRPSVRRNPPSLPLLPSLAPITSMPSLQPLVPTASPTTMLTLPNFLLNLAGQVQNLEALQNSVAMYLAGRLSALSPVQTLQLMVSPARRQKNRRSLQAASNYLFSGTAAFVGVAPPIEQVARVQVEALGDVAGLQMALDSNPSVGMVTFVSAQVDAVTSSPSSMPSVVPSLVPTPVLGIRDFLVAVLSPMLPQSSQSLIQQEQTPQNAALNWLSGINGTRQLPRQQIHQRYALAVLYFATEGDNWSVDGQWLGENSECLWDPQRIECDGPLVRILDLNFASLNGTLPPDVGLLTNLRK